MIRPYKRKPHRYEVGIVRADRHVLMEDGTISRLDRAPDDARLFADRDLIRPRLYRGDGRAILYNAVPVRWLPDVSRQVILLPGYPGEGGDLLDGLVAWRDFLWSCGASIGSNGHSGMSLLRASIDHPIFLGRGLAGPKLIEVVGGRQEAFVPPGHYSSFVHYDLKAAYASTLGALSYSGRWQQWPQVPTETHRAVFVRARIRFPKHLVAGPLPRRRKPPTSAFVRSVLERDYPTRGSMVGTWEASELAAATEAGCGVKVERAWLQTGPFVEHPFEAWWALIQAGRELPGIAGNLAKYAGNALWGTLIATGERHLVRYVDGLAEVIEALPIHQEAEEHRGTDVAEIITARVRSRLYRELMASAGDRLISVHTDGGLVADTVPGIGHGLGLSKDWRAKDAGDRLVYISPSCYRFRRPGTGTAYVMAGVRPRDRKMVFDIAARHFLGYPASANPSEDARALHRLTEAFPELVPQLHKGAA